MLVHLIMYGFCNIKPSGYPFARAGATLAVATAAKPVASIYFAVKRPKYLAKSTIFYYDEVHEISKL